MRVLVLISIIALSQEKTLWQNVKWLDSIYQPAVERYPAKPDRSFPSLKLFIYSTPSEPFYETYNVTFDKTPPENLNYYTAQLNKRFTVLYSHGFLDKTGLEDPSLGLLSNATTAALVFLPYWGRTLYADILSKDNPPTATPESWQFNFIVIDWSAYNRDYGKSLTFMPLIANIIGDKLFSMSQNSSDTLDLSKWHFIGHSLGAHMVGMIACRLKKKSGKIVVPRITGLDPAGPIIEFDGIRLFYPRLSKNCAEFVDIIHTDAGVFGSDRPSGHVDFWPNGGSDQPGCPKSTFTDILLRQQSISMQFYAIRTSSEILKDSCNHLRAIELYSDSVEQAIYQYLYEINYKNFIKKKYPFEAVLCTRLAEFNFLIDRVKIGKLQCTRNESNKAFMGLLASSDMPEGNYYSLTGSEVNEARTISYGLTNEGVLPYINGSADNKDISFS